MLGCDSVSQQSWIKTCHLFGGVRPITSYWFEKPDFFASVLLQAGNYKISMMNVSLIHRFPLGTVVAMWISYA